MRGLTLIVVCLDVRGFDFGQCVGAGAKGCVNLIGDSGAVSEVWAVLDEAGLLFLNNRDQGFRAGLE